MESKLKVLVLNGPNLNLVGQREPEIYGRQSMESILSELQASSEVLDMELTAVQSNFEGELLQHLQDAQDKYNLVLINPGALTHTSIALRDAISAISVPVIEVHITNIYAREEWRNHSMISSVCWGTMSGLGGVVYRLALEAGYHLYHSILKGEEAFEIERLHQVSSTKVARTKAAASVESKVPQEQVNPVEREQLRDYVAQAQQYAEQAQRSAEQAKSGSNADSAVPAAEVCQQLIDQMQMYVEQAQHFAEQARLHAQQGNENGEISRNEFAPTPSAVSAVEYSKSETQPFMRSEERTSQFVRSKEQNRPRPAEDKAIRSANSGVFISEEELPTFTPTCNVKRYQSDSRSSSDAPADEYSEPKIERASSVTTVPDAEVVEQTMYGTAISAKSEVNDSSAIERNAEISKAVVPEIAPEQPEAPKKKKTVHLELVFGDKKLSAPAQSDNNDKSPAQRRQSSLELAIQKDNRRESAINSAEIAPEPVVEAVQELVSDVAEMGARPSALLGDFADLPGEFEDREALSPDDLLAAVENVVSEMTGSPDEHSNISAKTATDSFNNVAIAQKMAEDGAFVDSDVMPDIVAMVIGEETPSDGTLFDDGSVLTPDTMTYSAGMPVAESVAVDALTGIDPVEVGAAETETDAITNENDSSDEGGRQGGRNKKGWRKKLGRLHDSPGKKR